MDPRTSCSAISILLVDDETSFRTSLADTLRDDGHDVLDYGTPADVPPPDALTQIAVLVTDYDMPGTTGVELADAFHARHPHLPVLLVTAYGTQALEAQIEARPYMSLLHKPVDYDEIHALIHGLASGT